MSCASDNSLTNASVRPPVPGAADRRLGLYLLFLAMAFAIGGLYYYLGSVPSLAYWFLMGVPLLLFASRLGSPAGARRYYLLLAIFSYMGLSVLGLFYASLHNASYGLTFSPGKDDSLFFERIIDIAYAKPTPASFYELFLGLTLRLASSLRDGIGLLDLLPFNWACGALSICLASRLSEIVSIKRCPWYSLVACTLGNAIFVDSTVHLFRDCLMLVFFMLSLIFAARKRYTLAFLFAVLCGGVRAANGMLALAGIGFLFLANTPLARQSRWLVTAGCFLAIVSIPIMDRYVPVGGYMREIVGEKAEENVTIAERAETRIEVAGYGKEDAPDDWTNRIYRLGPLGYIMRPVVHAINPVSFVSTQGEIAVAIWRTPQYYTEGYKPQAFLTNINVLLWILIGPPIFIGLWRSLQGSPRQRALFFIFLLILLGVSLVSYQQRHRLAFIALYPSFIAIAKERSYSFNERQISVLIRLMFILGILAINLI